MTAIAGFALIGFVLGLAYFAALRWTLDAYLRGRRAAIAWYVLRLAGIAAAFLVLVRLGGELLLASLGGFVIARVVAVRRGHAGREDA